jgi:hypothetical protein
VVCDGGVLQKCGSAISECTLFRDQLAAWKRDPSLENLFAYKFSQEDCAQGGRTGASEEYKALHGWKKGETKWSRAGTNSAIAEKKRPPKRTCTASSRRQGCLRPIGCRRRAASMA